MSDNKDPFEDWIDELTEQPQPTCNIHDPDNCDSCGS